MSAGGKRCSAQNPSHYPTRLICLMKVFSLRMLSLISMLSAGSKSATMCLGAEDSFVNFYYEYGNRLTADELMILQKFVNPENVKLADNIDYRLHNSHLMVVEKGVKRQAWLEGDEKLLQLITGNSLAVNNLKDDADLESAGSFSSLASESFIDVDLSDNVPNQLDESSIISLLKEYLKQALYKANNPPAGEYSVIMNFFHHSKESKTKVEEAIIALENTSKASLAIQIVIDLLKRHETPGSGLHTNSVDTYFLQFMYAEGSINNKFSKGLILFSVEDLKKYRFIPPNEDGFDCNGRVARSLRGKDRLPDAIAREAYRLGAINALLKIMSFICQIGAKQQPQNPEITYRQTSTL